VNTGIDFYHAGVHGKDHGRFLRDLIDECDNLFQALGIVGGFRPVEGKQIVSFGLDIKLIEDARLLLGDGKGVEEEVIHHVASLDDPGMIDIPNVETQS